MRGLAFGDVISPAFVWNTQQSRRSTKRFRSAQTLSLIATCLVGVRPKLAKVSNKIPVLTTIQPGQRFTSSEVDEMTTGEVWRAHSATIGYAFHSSYVKASTCARQAIDEEQSRRVVNTWASAGRETSHHKSSGHKAPAAQTRYRNDVAQHPCFLDHPSCIGHQSQSNNSIGMAQGKWSVGKNHRRKLSCRLLLFLSS